MFRFVTTWGWVKEDYFHFWVNHFFKSTSCHLFWRLNLQDKWDVEEITMKFLWRVSLQTCFVAGEVDPKFTRKPLFFHLLQKKTAVSQSLQSYISLKDSFLQGHLKWSETDKNIYNVTKYFKLFFWTFKQTVKSIIFPPPPKKQLSSLELKKSLSNKSAWFLIKLLKTQLFHQ